MNVRFSAAKLYNIAQKTKKNLVFCAEINTF